MDGLSATTEIEPSGKRTTTYPDGTTVALIDKADKRFGMQAPVAGWVQTVTGGLTQTMEQSRT